MKTLKYLIIAFLMTSLFGAFAADQAADKPEMKEQKSETAPHPGCPHGGAKTEEMMKDCCKNMMGECMKMQEMSVEANKKLDELLAAMNKEKGSKKADAMAKLLTELVAQQKQMNEMAVAGMMKCEKTRANLMMALCAPMEGCATMKEAGCKPGCKMEGKPDGKSGMKSDANAEGKAESKPESEKMKKESKPEPPKEKTK